jgi:hypothetical protein
MAVPTRAFAASQAVFISDNNTIASGIALLQSQVPQHCKQEMKVDRKP